MATVRIAPWISKKNAKGHVPLYLVIRHKKERATIAIEGVRLHPRHWNDARQEIRKTHPQYYNLNLYLKNVVDEAEEAVAEVLARDGKLSVRAVKAILVTGSDPQEADFLEYFQSRINEFHDRSQHGSVDAYKPVLSKLRDYTYQATRQRVLGFEQLTVAFLRGFHTYLVKVHGNRENTVTKNLGYVRTVLYIAIREGLFPQEKNPFFQLTLKTRRAKSNRLTIEEIRRIEDIELDDTLLNDVRNYFIFAFYAAGMRISDVIQLVGDHIRQESGVWRIEYTMAKTDDPSFSMPLLSKPEEILRFYGWPDIGRSEYIFPILPKHVRPGTEEAFRERKKKTALINKYLKTLARECGIEMRLTTHMARHSWAAFMDENNLPIQRIQQTLAHKDAKTTQAYLQNLRSGMVDDELIRVLKRH
ncbi:MAG: hypothetical protein BMS9Abin05_2134 [Rhodothermia bacterium]|nr:MAG: hypothetical protein BMS9Abin05_2134 [Rhodothermia bacterium]